MYGILAPSPELNGLKGTLFVILRDTFQSNGDIESKFFGLTKIIHSSFSGGKISDVLTLAVKDENISSIVIVRNSKLVLDHAIFDRVQSTLDSIASFGSEWAICAAGGKGPNGERYNAMYSGHAPALPVSLQMRPITDALPDLYIANAEHVRDVLQNIKSRVDTALEPILVLDGYLKNKISLFCPTLSAGINAHYTARDTAKLESELSAHFCDLLPGAEIKTLSGPINVPAQHYPARLANGTVADRPSPYDKIDHDNRIAAVISRNCRPLSISIITRTQFSRPHLLRRLLTTISRSRLDGMELEIILATDIEKNRANEHLNDLRKAFANLNIVVAHNQLPLHSRVGNLIAGVKKASNDYVMFLDDDDYLDIFAFQKIGSLLFRDSLPIIIADSEVHKETWIENVTGIHVLAESKHETKYSHTNWVNMFSGVNPLPICSTIFPRGFIKQRLEKSALRYDLSEDYALFLLFFSAPNLPELVELNSTISHISLRSLGDNTVTMTDRTKWTHDIAGFLHDLIKSEASSPGIWQLLSRAHRGAQYDQSALIEQQKKQLQDQAKEISLLKRQISAYRHTIENNSTQSK